MAMRARARILAALRSWLRPSTLDAEVAEELRFHLEQEIAANRAAGMTAADARQQAFAVLGNPAAVREQSRAARPGALVHQVVRDLTFGVRLLRRSPGFAVVAALVVALGVGAATAIFSVVYAVMLKSPPYREPDRIVALWTRLPDAPQRRGLNPADHRDIRGGNGVFEDIALANAPQNFNLIGVGDPERLLAARLSSNLLSVLGVTPALGRAFTAEEEQSGRDRVVLLGDALWRRRFGADPSIVGRTINLSGQLYEVVGVMAPDFRFPEREHQLWIPLTINPRVMARQLATYDHLAVARLKPGIAIATAQQEIDAVTARLAAAYPATNRGVRLEVLPLVEESVRRVRPALYVMLGAVGSLLLIACLNLASLLASRAANRAQEFSVRLALGASRGRLTLQALAEIAPILGAGGLAGVAAARFAVGAFVPVAPAALPRVDAIEVDAAVLAFSLLILLVTGASVGMLPAVQAWRARETATIGSRSATGSPRHARMRSRLVVAQLALTLPLLVGATVLARSFAAVHAVDPGFTADRVLKLHLAMPRTKYRSDEQIAAFYSRLVDRVSTITGVASAAMVNRVPLTANDFVLEVQFDGHAGPLTVQSRSVTPEYFRTMGIPLRDGRDVSERDGARAPLVGIIDDRLAGTLWPGQNPLGKRFRVTLPGEQEPASGEVIGVVGNIRHRALEVDADRQLYLSYRQFTDGRMALVVRSRGAVSIVSAVVDAVRALDPEQPVYDVSSMADVVARSAAERWMNTAIVTVFALTSLALAAVGLYGVIAHGVTQRVREFGVRMALGAAPSDVSRLVLRHGAMLAAAGAVLGIGAAVATTRALGTLLYSVSPLDPVSFAAAAAMLFAAALAASYLPARRAARADPTQALRAD